MCFDRSWRKDQLQSYDTLLKEETPIRHSLVSSLNFEQDENINLQTHGPLLQVQTRQSALIPPPVISPHCSIKTQTIQDPN